MGWLEGRRRLGVLTAAGTASALLVAGLLAAQPRQRDVQVRPRAEVRLFDALGSTIGVSIREVTEGDVAKLKLASLGGAVVEQVDRDGPAERAGLRAGDVLIEFDGERVRSALELTRLVRETPSGRAVKVGIVREGRRTDVTVTPESHRLGLVDERALERAIEGGLGQFRDRLEQVPRSEPGWPWLFEAPQGPRTLPVPPFAPPLWASPWRLGVTVQELTPQLAEYFGVKEGVLISAVTDNSPASKAGLKAGDVITAIDGKSVRNRTDLTRALRDREGSDVSLTIVRDRKTQTIKVTLEGSRQRRVRV
jgi:serine protease Do